MNPVTRKAASRGFTFIELVITVALVGLLSMFALPLYEMTSTRMKESELRQALRVIRVGIDAYKAATDAGTLARETGEDLQELVAKKYLRQIPLDPVTEAANWVVIAPADPTLGNVYDVQPAPQAQNLPAEGK